MKVRFPPRSPNPLFSATVYLQMGRCNQKLVTRCKKFVVVARACPLESMSVSADTALICSSKDEGSTNQECYCIGAQALNAFSKRLSDCSLFGIRPTTIVLMGSRLTPFRERFNRNESNYNGSPCTQTDTLRAAARSSAILPRALRSSMVSKYTHRRSRYPRGVRSGVAGCAARSAS